jgi:hypothetical protein
MASNSFTAYLDPLLQDAEELDIAHGRLRTGARGRQYGIGALNRAAVVMALSAWEAYVEELAKECVETIRPAHPHPSVWQSLNASVRSQVGRFNTPNPENIRMLFSDAIGVPDVTQYWTWQGTTPSKASQRLRTALGQRHKIAHGVHPRPVVHNQYSSLLPAFFRRLGRATDSGVRAYLIAQLGVINPWPP